MGKQTLAERLDEQAAILGEILRLVERDRLKPFLTVQDAAEESRTSPQTITRAINAGLLATVVPKTVDRKGNPVPLDKRIIARADFMRWMGAEDA